MRVFTISAVFLAILCCYGQVAAETWYLEKGDGWKAASKSERGRYLLAVAEFKSLISQGDSESAKKAAWKLKNDFPGIGGTGFDTFVDSELLFSAGKFPKAIRGYDKFLDEYPESELAKSVMERQFQIATAYLGGQKRSVLKVLKMTAYEEGEKIMDRIVDRAGDAPISQRAMIAVAESFEKRGEFAAGYERWAQIRSLRSAGDIGKDALAGMARCMLAAYEGAKYDSSTLISAKQYYRQFKREYPNEARLMGVGEILARIEDKIAYKQYMIGKYYDKTGSKLAANLYYQQVLENWPGSSAAKFIKITEAESEKQKSENDH